MARFIIPIFIALASVGVFFGYTNNLLEEVNTHRDKLVEYKKAVDNSKQLLKKRDELLEKKNLITDEDLNKLNTLIPVDVNTTKLILEIQNLASNVHGLVFENPKYDPNKKVIQDARPTQVSTGGQSDTEDSKQKPVTVSSSASTPRDALLQQRDYGTFELEFTVVGTYDKFIGFIQDLEKSLRIVDIQSVQIGPKENAILKYVVKIQTYWLKS